MKNENFSSGNIHEPEEEFAVFKGIEGSSFVIGKEHKLFQFIEKRVNGSAADIESVKDSFYFMGEAFLKLGMSIDKNFGARYSVYCKIIQAFFHRFWIKTSCRNTGYQKQTPPVNYFIR
jgi:hypothetical protein